MTMPDLRKAIELYRTKDLGSDPPDNVTSIHFCDKDRMLRPVLHTAQTIADVCCGAGVAELSCQLGDAF